MRHPVSTRGCLKQPLGGAMLSGVVGFAIDPCAPEHAQPGAREDANGVRMITAASAGLSGSVKMIFPVTVPRKLSAG